MRQRNGLSLALESKRPKGRGLHLAASILCSLVLCICAAAQEVPTKPSDKDRDRDRTQQQTPGQPDDYRKLDQTNRAPDRDHKSSLDRALDVLNETNAKNQKAPITINPLKISSSNASLNINQVTVGSTVTFTVIVSDPLLHSLNKPPSYSYAMSGAPWGSYIDPVTGVFTWVPYSAGQYTFYVWVMDNNDNTRQSSQQVVINVSAPLQPYGYELFQKSRAVIDTRMFLIHSGLLQGFQPLASPTGSSSLLPLSQLQSVQPTIPLTPQGQSSTPQPGMGLGSAPTGGSAGGYPGMSTPFGNGAASSQIQQLGQLQQSPFMPGGGSGLGQGGPFGSSMAAPQQGALPGGLPNGGTGYTGTSLYSGGIFGGSSTPFSGQGSTPAFGSQSPTQGALPGQSPFDMQNQNSANGLPSPFGLSPLASYQQQPMGLGMSNQGFSGATFNQGGPFGTGIFPTAPGGVTIAAPTAPFGNLQNKFINIPQSNGLPSGVTGMTADALRYIVSPLEMMGFNVYVPAPERYQLGPGDLLTARIWSPTIVAQDYDLKIDQRGYITIPDGNLRLVLRGLTLAEAENRLRQIVRKHIHDGNVQLTLKELRTMSVQVLGEAYLPGTYQVPAVATLFNTLYVCGGPNASGSMRKIELRRSDGTKKVFDLYGYLTKGDTSADVPLEPGDTIFIPVATDRVTINGEVPRPAIYEALPNDTLKDLISFAGGAKATGVPQSVYVQTEDKNVGHVVKDVDIVSGTNTLAQLYDGDTATVLSVRSDVLNDLNLDGAVALPGTFQYKKGITVADLISDGRGLLPSAYNVRADLFRQNSDKTTTTLIPVDLQGALARQPAANLQLMPHDHLVIYAQDDVKWKGTRVVTIQGDVQKPGQYTRSDNMRVADLILQAGGLMPDAFTEIAYLQHQNPDGNVGPLVKINIKRLAAGDKGQDPLLLDNDELTIQSNAQAKFIPDESVNILGAVQAPGNYARGVGMRVSDLIQEAGGIMPNSGATVEITHARVPDNFPRTRVRLADVISGDPQADVTLVDGDFVSIPERSDIDLAPLRVVIVGRVKNPGAYTISHTDHISDIVARAGGLMDDAFINGTQFYRDPEKLVSDTQKKLTPRIRDVASMIAADDYTRALAYSVVQKAQFLKVINGGSATIPIPGLGSASENTGSVNIPPSIWDQPTVTPGEPLTTDDLTPFGNITVKLGSALAHKHSRDDVLLFDGDIIVIPRTPITVTVVGAVMVPSGIRFDPGRTVSYYLDRAGGLQPDAAKTRILVLRAGGTVELAKKGTIIGLGDQVFVPTTAVATEFRDKAAETDALAKNIIAGAVIIALLHALF